MRWRAPPKPGSHAGERAGRAGLHYCIEPLSRDQTSVVNTVDEALAIVEAAALPGLKTMLDTRQPAPPRASRCRR